MSEHFSPSSEESENVVVAAMLQYGHDAITVAHAKLRSEMLFHHGPRMVFETILSLWLENEPVDLITVTQHFLDCRTLEKIGGCVLGEHYKAAGYLSALGNTLHVARGEVRHYARTVWEKWLFRETLKASEQIIASVHENQTDLESVIVGAEKGLLRIVNAWRGSKQGKSTSETATEILEQFQKGDAQALFGVSTGFPSLDAEIGGFCKGDLIVISAPSSGAKSALALNIANAFSRRREHVGYFTFEMTQEQQVKRLIQIQGGSNLRDAIKTGDLLNDSPRKNVERGAHETMQSLIVFIDDKTLDIRGAVSEARRLHALNPLGLIVLDYDELIRGERMKGDNYEQELASIARNWKGVAMELGIPAILLSQETRDEKTGSVKLRHSSAKLNYANVLLMIEVGETQKEKKIVIRKQRDGRKGATVELEFDEAITRFREKRF